ncbi:hypothetical protein BGZ80_004487 [Entomortierella chlamydospora]|uniref:Uncharacterized protein n=1 Tax=Entomortierella chlamydospora TaxID=101097 RepID=A0A9P6MNB2_9FUNG|nr:hypothetical protein BGZ80_004487 [Entomortierella chlamydospora]
MEESIPPVNVDESYDHDDNGGLPTPDVSPEELSESSEELVIIQGDLLEESRSKSEDRVRQFHYGSFPEDGVDAAATGDASANAGAMVGSFSWLTESPFIDALVNWIEGPETSAQQRNADKDKPNPWLDIPLQFIALLTYPEPDPKNGNKMSLAMVRETAFVRQRRKTLMMLTAYTLVVRYCSFDSFLAILFASNCAMLFLMKNSGRMNVNMAKRAVRQRVGWAKQWAGGIFKRGGGGSNANTSSPSNNNSNSNSNRTGSGGSQYLSVTANSPPSPIINRQMQSSPVPVDVTILTVENSPLMKRRGLFGKRKTVDNHGSAHIASSSSSQVFATSLAPASQGRYPGNGDGASILSVAPTMSTAGTQKKRFFRRGNTTNNTTNTNSNNSSSTVVVPTPSAPVTIPSKRSISSTVSHPTAQHAGTSTPMARTTTTNTPLSTSPLAQSQSLPHYRLSHLKSSTSPVLSSNESDMDKMDSKWPIMLRSITSTPPPLLPVMHSAQQSKGPSLSSPETSSSGDSTPSSSESVSMPTSTSAPLMVSGLSQLLGKDKAQSDSAHWEDDILRGGEEGNEEGRVNVDQDSVRSNFTLDAVTSASAEAMEGV